MTYPERLNLIVSINGVAVTSYVRPTSLKIESVLTSQVDTCSLTLEDAAALGVEEWMQIIVTDGATRIFGGYITSLNKKEGANLGVDVDVSASDFSVRFEKVIVKKQYKAQTDAQILADIFATYLSMEGYDAATYVSSIKLFDQIRFNRVTLPEVINQLCSLTGADWYVDEFQRLHYFPANAAALTAPFELSDTPNLTLSFPYSDFNVNRDGSGIVNRVEVVGGNYLSEDTTFYLPGTGQENRILLPFRMSAPDGYSAIRVWRNDGTEAVPVWTSMTVKVGYIDDLAGVNEVLYYYQDKVIEQQNPFPALPNALRIFAKYEVPLRTRIRDDASYAHYGLWFDEVITDSNITTKQAARLAAAAKLALASFGKVAISLSTAQPGLRAGQIVTVGNALHGIKGSYTVQRVSIEVGIYGRAVYRVELGTYSPDFFDFLVKLARKIKQAPPWREDEVLDEVLQAIESITLAESTAQSTSVGPYYFSETLADAFIWGFGTFQP